MVLFRRLLGEVLRARRMEQGRSLRDLCAEAAVSLGYMSEIERGQKEASSELLSAICEALDLPLSALLSSVSDRFALEEGVEIPDTIPQELSDKILGRPGGYTVPRLAAKP